MNKKGKARRWSVAGEIGGNKRKGIMLIIMFLGGIDDKGRPAGL